MKTRAIVMRKSTKLEPGTIFEDGFHYKVVHVCALDVRFHGRPQKFDHTVVYATEEEILVFEVMIS